MDLASVKPDVFEALLEQDFSALHDEGDAVAAILTLKGVTRSPHGHPGREEPFSLIFESPSSTPLEQGSYRLRHEETGTHELLIVPTADDGTVRCYQIVFN